MNLDDLRAVQVDERGTDSLRPLSDSFYRDVGDYLDALRDERARAADRADNPFDSEEVRRLSDEIETAEEVVEAIYERRVGKVVKRASLAAAGMPADDEGLTDEESELFDDLVSLIEANRGVVLSAFDAEADGSPSPSTATDAAPGAGADVGAPSDPGGSAAPDAGIPEHSSAGAETAGAETAGPEAGGDPTAGREAGGLDAGDVMGRQPDGSTDTEPPETPPGETGSPPAETDSEPSREPAHPESIAEETGPVDSAGDPDGDEAARTAQESEDDRDGEGVSDERDGEAVGDEPDPGVGPVGSDERVTLRITREVGEIFGVDERVYELGKEDVVTLPEENAKPLLDRDAAQKLD